MSVERVPTLSGEESAQPEADEDFELAELLREDPVKAAKLLHERFGEEVNRLVWRLLGADPEHNDIVQQVFLKVLLYGRRLRDSSRLKPWIQSITVNAVYEELRRREVRRLFVRDWNPVEFHPDLVREVETRDLLAKAQRLIAQLPANERVVFTLHFVEDMPLHEIAALCGFSHATAKRRLWAANRRFQALIAHSPELVRLLRARERKR